MESKRLQEDTEAGRSGPPLKQLKLDLPVRSDSLQSNSSDRSDKSDSSGSSGTGTISASGINQKKAEPSMLSGNADDDDDDGDDDNASIGSFFEFDDDDDDEVILNYNVQHESDKGDYKGPTLDDGVVVPRKMECHQLFCQPTKDAFNLFNIKQLLVHHDYILFPYCLDLNGDGVMERLPRSRVSHIIRIHQDFPRGERYKELQQTLNMLSGFLDGDTSTLDDLENLAFNFDNEKFSESLGTMSPLLKVFGQFLMTLFQRIRARKSLESDYRLLFARFLQMITVDLGYQVIEEHLESPKIKIEFPLKKCNMTLSGRENIRVQDLNGRNVLIVECKRYRPVNIVYSSLPLPNPDGKDFKKLKPKLGSRVSFSQDAETADKEDIRKRVYENMYKDLDKNICRHLKPAEKGLFGKVIAQLVGELLAWFDLMRTATYHDMIQEPRHLKKKKKVVRYGICQIGFKIIFVTIGINSDFIGKYPYLRIGTGKAEAHGVDAFMTRPFDLMKADDRSTIADIVFAMLLYCRW